jgi:hypothetical protein
MPKETQMRVEENSYPSVKFTGMLNQKPVGEELRYLLDPSHGRLLASFSGPTLHSHIFFNDLPRLLNFYRDLGAALDFIQPGLVNPLPDGDSNEVDAMKVIYVADQLKKGVAV